MVEFDHPINSLIPKLSRLDSTTKENGIKKTPKWRFYFFDEINNAINQPMNDHPSNQEPHLVRILSVLSRSFTAARYAGVSNTQIKMNAAIAYFATIKIFIPINNFYLPYVAAVPSSSSMRINWLYFAIRSVLDIEPVLI